MDPIPLIIIIIRLLLGGINYKYKIEPYKFVPRILF